MSISREDYEKAKKLEGELIRLKEDMKNVMGYPDRIKGDTFYVRLDGGGAYTLFFPPYMAVEITKFLYDMCHKEYRQARENFDRFVTEQE